MKIHIFANEPERYKDIIESTFGIYTLEEDRYEVEILPFTFVTLMAMLGNAIAKEFPSFTGLLITGIFPKLTTLRIMV